MLLSSLFLSLLAMTPEMEWAIRGTEIYQPLQPGEVIVTPKGETLILNFAGSVITRFDANGEKANTIGFKGRGPGGLTYPMVFFLEDEVIYVHDLIDSTINSFHLDGKFIEKVRCPKRNMQLAKVKGGWVYGNWQISPDQKPDPSVNWADGKFENQKKLLDLKTTGEQGGLNMDMNDGEVKAVFTPVSSAPRMVYSPDHSKIYIAEAQGFRIYVIDGATGKLINTITRNDRPIPFDKDWGDSRLENLKEMMAARGHSAKIDKNYPENFPIVRDMKVLPDGTLVVDRWRGNPEENHWTIAFGPNGEALADSPEWTTVERIAGGFDGWLFVTTLDDEEAGLGRCKPENLAAFVKDHPIDFEGTVGRRITMEN